jgi:hypothetical protein
MLSAKRSEFLSGQAFHFSIAEEGRKNRERSVSEAPFPLL